MVGLSVRENPVRNVEAAGLKPTFPAGRRTKIKRDEIQ